MIRKFRAPAVRCTPLTALTAFTMLGAVGAVATGGGCSSSHPARPGTTGEQVSVGDLPVTLHVDGPAAFTQEIDHGAHVGLFLQRYWVARDFARGPDSPVLFVFCGESECSPSYAQAMG